VHHRHDVQTDKSIPEALTTLHAAANAATAQAPAAAAAVVAAMSTSVCSMQVCDGCMHAQSPAATSYSTTGIHILTVSAVTAAVVLGAGIFTM
jgi:hypothetical protein